MLVLKRSGSTEKFNINKISTSIINSTNDINFPLNEGDVNMLLREINKKLAELREDNEVTSVYEIRGIIYDVLMNNHFELIAKSYMKFI